MIRDFKFDFDRLDKHLKSRYDPEMIVRPIKMSFPPQVIEYCKGRGLHYCESKMRPLPFKGFNVWPKDAEFFTKQAEMQYGRTHEYVIPDLFADPDCLIECGPEKYDYYLSIDHINYVPNPTRMLLEANRVVKEDGYIILMGQHPRALTSECHSLYRKPTVWNYVPLIKRAYWQGWGYDNFPKHSRGMMGKPRIHRFWTLFVKGALEIVNFVNDVATFDVDDKNRFVRVKSKPFEVVWQEDLNEWIQDCWLIILKNNKAVKLDKPFLDSTISLSTDKPITYEEPYYEYDENASGSQDNFETDQGRVNASTSRTAKANDGGIPIPDGEG